MGFFGLPNTIGVDLGTSSTVIYVKKKGIAFRESSVVAVKSDSQRQILLAGNDAKQIIGKAPKCIQTVRPLKDGVIADIDMAPRMLKYFIKKIFKRSLLMKLRVVICYHAGITQVERIAIEETAYRAGAKDVFLISIPLAAAFGTGLPVDKPVGNIVVDIGGGTTDIAIISSGDVIISKSIKSGGEEMDQAIAAYIKRKYNLIIGEVTAERIKIEIGSALLEENPKTMNVGGRDLVSGLPKLLTITSEEINEALSEPIMSIVYALKSVLEMTPPELSADIINNGILLTGGGALLNGFDKLIGKEISLPVAVADNPLDCAAIGTGKALENIRKLTSTNSLLISKRNRS